MGNQNAPPLQGLKTGKVMKMAESRFDAKTMDELTAAWLKVAKGKKASINFEQFAELMELSSTDEKLRALFSLYDLNNDNKITWKEYICVVALLLGGSVEEKLVLLFNAFDENKDGKVSKQEFQEAVEKFSRADSENAGEFVEEVFGLVDTNNDGLITLDEFRLFMELNRATFDKACGILGVAVVIK